MSMHTFVDSLTQLLQWQRTTEAWELLAAQDDPHAAFDQEINDVQAAYTKLSENFVATLQRLCIGRNGLAPIHRLPNEVLLQIFRQSTGCGWDRRSNFAIATTCSRWRSAALEDSMLWSCIQVGLKLDVRIATLFFERSRNYPLTLFVHYVHPSHKSLVSQLLARTRSISTSVSPTELLLEPMPFLEDLTLHGPEWQTTVLKKISNFPLANLHELTMQDCYLDLKPGNYMGLRRLKIMAPLHPDSTHADLLVIFCESPLLEDLSLIFTTTSRRSPERRMPIVIPPRKIKMDSLRSLKLSMLSVEVVNILSAIDISEAIQFVDITVSQQETRLDDEENHVRSLFAPQCLPTNLVECLRSLSICHYRNTDKQVWKLAGEGFYEDTRRKCTLSITCGPTRYASDTFLRVLIDHCPLALVTSLTISTSGLLSSSSYALVLAHCPATIHLSIHFFPGRKPYTLDLHSFCDSIAKEAAPDGHLPPLSSIRFAVLEARDSPIQMSVRGTIFGFDIYREEPCLALWTRSAANPAWLFNLGGSCADGGIKALLSRFSSTLKQIEFISLPLSAHDSNCTPSECMKVFVEAVRNVGLEVHVTATGLLCPDLKSKCGMPCYPRAVWPAGEDCTWTCNMQASHGPLTQYCVGCGWEPHFAPLP